MVRSVRDSATVAYFTERSLGPSREVRRYDGTADLTWHVDDCHDRYVRATSSVYSNDYVLVSRNLRLVECCILGSIGEIFEWVRSHLAGLSRSSLDLQHSVASPGEVT
jgi:hypothetical protein